MPPSLSRRDQAALAAYLPDEAVDEAPAQQSPPPQPPKVRRRRLQLPAWLVSAVVHLTATLVLAMVYLDMAASSATQSVLAVPTATDPSMEIDSLDPLVLPEEMTAVDALALRENAVTTLDTVVPEEISSLSVGSAAAPPPLGLELAEFADESSQRTELLSMVGSAVGEELKSRTSEMRGTMLGRFGGTKGSERAVALALKWFAAHQRQDGSWNFDFRHSCRMCSQSGRLANCPTGATAMALLPFLGAGHTHKEGKYSENVKRGLQYLLKVQGGNGSLVSGGGNLYSHGLCAITLCEAYAMTREPFLKLPAQKALNFTVFAQDPVGGGWRYTPQQEGDTSAVAWQVMALKSGHMANLNIPPRSVLAINKFLTSVQSEGGAYYGYTVRRDDPRPSTTAAGLLCRMYLGWDKNNKGLAKGVERLAALGPAANDEMTRYHMYYNYYATQVLRHYGDPYWEHWNETLREFLVKNQETAGHMAGSWAIPNYENAAHDSEMGGRHYYTSLATMILEVYYRHMPIYSESAADEFPLE